MSDKQLGRLKVVPTSTVDDNGNPIFYDVKVNGDHVASFYPNPRLNISADAARDNAQIFACSVEMLSALERARLTISRLRGSMQAHPDCITNSEFMDRVTEAEETYAVILQVLQKVASK